MRNSRTFVQNAPDEPRQRRPEQVGIKERLLDLPAQPGALTTIQPRIAKKTIDATNAIAVERSATASVLALAGRGGARSGRGSRSERQVRRAAAEGHGGCGLRRRTGTSSWKGSQVDAELVERAVGA